MITSTDRIVTTHVGSLARPRPLLEQMRDLHHGRPVDLDAYRATVAGAVRDVVRRQAEVGLDIVADGEMGKASFFTYVVDRLSGFSHTDGEKVLPPSWRLEIDAYPGYYEQYLGKYEEAVTELKAMACTGPVAYVGHDALAADIANLRGAIDALPSDLHVAEAFMPSTSPRGFGTNHHYPTDDEYLEAVAEALRVEYLAIVEAGFVLQIDDPWLIEILTGAPGADPDECRREADRHVEIVNHSLRDIPTDRIRLHTCYGLNHGPRTHDLPMADIVEHMLRVHAGAYSFEVANPRHMHEWRLWETIPVPDDKVLVPGLIGHATNYVEHPELIADYIEHYARVVGRERVIAGADCGFSSRASFRPEVHPEVVWKKFEALAEGARLATERLW
jgi:5-methyltetrahydropteroyltriglutamate--homocysteine methyltransferase